MIETHVDSALETVEGEREALAEERAAYGRFRRRVESLSATEARPATGGSGTALGAVAARTGGDTGDSACAKVREAFAETVRPHSVDDIGDDEPLLETIREELGDGVALAVAPTTDPVFTPRTKRAVLSAVHDRRHGIDATTDSLESEAESLEAVGETVGAITDWVMLAEETPLSSFGFETLHERHDRLTEYRERCERLLAERQALLHRTTGRNAAADVSHRSLVRYLYQPFPVVYPVLSTLTRLYDLLADCQRTVRDHLTHRV